MLPSLAVGRGRPAPVARAPSTLTSTCSTAARGRLYFFFFAAVDFLRGGLPAFTRAAFFLKAGDNLRFAMLAA